MSDSTAPTENPDQLFYDLQQFLFDARDQHAALDRLKGELTSLLQISVRREKGFGEALKVLERQIETGVSIHANRSLTSAISDLKGARSEITGVTTDLGGKVASAFLYLPVVSGLSAIFGAYLGILIGSELL